MPPKQYAVRRKLKRTIKRSFKFNIWRSLANRGHIYNHIIRTQPLPVINNSLGSNLNSYYGFYGQLSASPQVAEFTALYDEYKINRIKFTFYPTTTGNQIGTAGFMMTPVYYTVDFNDDHLTSLNAMLQNASMKTKTLGQKFSVSFVPRTLDLVEAGVPATDKNRWLSTADAEVKYYALKMYIPDIAPTLTGGNARFDTLFTLVAEYHVSFRGQM